MKYLSILFLIFIFPIHNIKAQSKDSLTLETCYVLAKANYPALQQKPLLQKQLALTLKNIKSHYLPQFSLRAEATYQSDVTSIPLKLPGTDIPEVAKDQYRAAFHLQQLIYDGGSTEKQKQIQKTKNSMAEQQQAISFHQLKNQLNQLYAAILLADANINAVQTRQVSLRKQLQLTKAAIKNGIALPSHADELQVALLQGNQQLTILQANRLAGIRSLSIITGKALSDNVLLILPRKTSFNPRQEIERPALQQLTLKTKLLKNQSSLLNSGNLPKVSLFADGGYGRPGLNMLNDHFEWFYTAGVKLQWDLWDWNRKDRKQQSLKLDVQKIELQKEDFLLQTETKLARILSKIQALTTNVQKDKQITQLRKKISQTAASQLKHGTITPTEYLIKLNDETAAQIQQHSHLIALRFAKLNYQLLKNK